VRAFTDYFTGDLSLQERLLGDPAMTNYIGGPETPEKSANDMSVTCVAQIRVKCL